MPPKPPLRPDKPIRDAILEPLIVPESRYLSRRQKQILEVISNEEQGITPRRLREQFKMREPDSASDPLRTEIANIRDRIEKYFSDLAKNVLQSESIRNWRFQIPDARRGGAHVRSLENLYLLIWEYVGTHGHPDNSDVKIHGGESQKFVTYDTATSVDGGPNRLDEIRRRGTLRIGCFKYPPMIDYTIDDQGQVVASGCFVRFIEHIAKHEKLKTIYRPVRSSQLTTIMKEQKLDLIPCTFDTPRRRQAGDFTGFLYRTRLEAVCPKKKRKVFRFDDLKRPDVRIIVAPGEIGWEFAVDSLDLRDNKYRRFQESDAERVEEMMYGVASGVYDVAIADALSCRTFCRAHPESVVLAFAEKAEDVLNVFSVGTFIPAGDHHYKDWLNGMFELARKEPLIQEQEEHALEQSLGAFTRRSL